MESSAKERIRSKNAVTIVLERYSQKAVFVYPTSMGVDILNVLDEEPNVGETSTDPKNTVGQEKCLEMCSTRQCLKKVAESLKNILWLSSKMSQRHCAN